MTGVVIDEWVDEWALDLAGIDVPFQAKRAKRRLSHREIGTEEYLLCWSDTSDQARRVDSTSPSL